MPDAGRMKEMEDYLEFQRHSDEEGLAEVLAALDEAGIPYRTASTAPGTETSWTGTGNLNQIVISIPGSRHADARQLMEARYLELDLPEDHHLRSASDEDIIEILSHESEWSPFDVAHARRIAAERTIDEDFIHHIAGLRLSRLQEGKQASRFLTLGGLLLAILGASGYPLLSIMALGIGWSLISMKEKLPEGHFPTYDPASRKIGKVIAIFALLTLAVSLILSGRALFSQDFLMP